MTATDERRRGRLGLLPALSLSLVLFLGAGVFFLRAASAPPATAATQATDPAADDPVVFLDVPAFRLTDQDGEPLSDADLRGTPWALAAIFTRCAGPCPQMTRGMRRLQDRLDGSSVRLVSVSVDPGYDTPPILSEYAAAHDADLERWSFLTGDELVVYELLTQGFAMAVERNEGEEAGQAVTHFTRAAAVDGRGRVRGWYPVDTDADVRRLAERLRFLESEGE